jgi:hypothetical protein
MGISLYLRTENPAVLEKLAGVEAGTHYRLRRTKASLITTRKGVRYYHVEGKGELVAVRDFNDMETLWQHEWDAVSNDGQLSRMNGFLLCGWGKVNWLAADYLKRNNLEQCEGGMECVGGLDDPEQVAHMLFNQDVDIYAPGGDMAKAFVCVGNPWNRTRIPVADLGGVCWY